MSNRYTPIAHNDEEESPLKSHPSPGPHSGDTISVGRRTFALLVILTILNMIVAVAHGYYSLRITNLLREYQEKPLSSLPRIDAFNGQYQKPPLAGKIKRYIMVISLTHFQETQITEAVLRPSH